MNAKQIAALSAALSDANGKRRERTADLADVLRVVALVARGADGAGLRRTCGTVPNSYGYKALATVITAVRVSDYVRVLIREGRAAQVSGGGNGWTESAKNQDVAALLADPAPLAPWQTGALAPVARIVLPLASAKRPPVERKAGKVAA